MGIFNNNCISCGAAACDCVNPAAQVIGCISPSDIELSEIKYLILDCPDGTDPSIPSTPVTGYVSSDVDETVNDAVLRTWYDGIDNTVAGGIKIIEGIGSIAQPEEIEVALPDGQGIVIMRRWTMNFRVPHANQVTRNYFKWIQGCAPKLFSWYGSRGCGHYGGENGIYLKSIKAASQHDEGNESVVNWNLTLVWESLCEPARDFLAI